MVSFNTDGKAIFIVFIGAIVALALIATIFQSTSEQTTTIAANNITVTAAAVNTTLDLTGRELISEITIVNSSNGTQSFAGAGASLQTGIGSNGLLSVQLILNDTAAGVAGEDVDISYTANPDGYISDAGARSVTLLIGLFAALAILVFVLVVLIKEGSLGKLVGRQ